MHSWKVGAVLLFTIIFCVQYGFSIKCFHCNSAADKACEDPFDGAGLPLTDCEQVHPGKNSTFCRKNTQKATLMGKYDARVIRTCGHIEENKPGAVDKDDDEDAPSSRYRCYTKPGTFEVEVRYCTCNEDGCNPADKISGNYISITLTVAAMVLSYLLF